MEKNERQVEASMEIKYYIGMNEVSMTEFEDAEHKAVEDGRTIKSSEIVDGYPTFTLENGVMIRGDKNGGFNRVENGQIEEKWEPGTVNEWVQDEPTDTGKANFFVKA